MVQKSHKLKWDQKLKQIARIFAKADPYSVSECYREFAATIINTAIDDWKFSHSLDYRRDPDFPKISKEEVMEFVNSEWIEVLFATLDLDPTRARKMLIKKSLQDDTSKI